MSLRSLLTVVQSSPPCSTARLFFIIDAEPMDSNAVRVMAFVGSDRSWQPQAAHANCEVVAVHGQHIRLLDKAKAKHVF